jgi:hypothetical protein
MQSYIEIAQQAEMKKLAILQRILAKQLNTTSPMAITKAKSHSRISINYMTNQMGNVS